MRYANRARACPAFCKSLLSPAAIECQSESALAWSGSEDTETGADAEAGKTFVRVNPAFYRPAEVELLIGGPAKAKADLGWEPEVQLEELARLMVEAGMRRNKAGWSF